MLPPPAGSWEQRQACTEALRALVGARLGVIQVATARVVNSTGQRTPKGRLWRPATASALLNGRYGRGTEIHR
jgi:hypothetical protein